jgi:hypothetical protein
MNYTDARGGFRWVDDKGDAIPWEFQNPAEFRSLVLAHNLERFAEQNLKAASEATGDLSPEFLRGQADAFRWVAEILTAMATEDYSRVPHEILYPDKFKAKFREHSPIANFVPREEPNVV